jgi:hypothetical protein
VEDSTATGWIFDDPVEYRDATRWPVGEGPFSFKLSNDRELRRQVVGHVGDFYKELFLVKNRDWSYEKEYRWIFWGDGSDGILLPFGDALRGIVVGQDFGQTPEGGSLPRLGYIKELKRLCKDLGIQAFAIWWDNGAARLSQLKTNRELGIG